MALVYTPATKPGQKFTHFQLPTVEGKIFDTKEIPVANAIVLMFICNHCPYVQAVEDRIIQLAKDFSKQPVSFVGICSNDPSEYPEDRPEELLKRSKEKDYPFEYLVDASQEVAKIFDAVCTPDFFVFAPGSPAPQLFYRGRLDDSWKDPNKVSRRELNEALKQLFSKKPAPDKQIPSMGCSIKWLQPSSPGRTP